MDDSIRVTSTRAIDPAAAAYTICATSPPLLLVPPLPLAPPQTGAVEDDSPDSVLMQEFFGAMRVNAGEVAPHQTHVYSKTL